MSKQVLEMWYHPAKKEVVFKLFRGNAPITIPKNSVLQRYMRQEKGTFILQNQGKNFFDSIAKIFSGHPDGTIRAITTRADFIDFQQMVEHYNSGKEAKCQFTVLPGAVETNTEAYLPDMNMICNEVRQHGVNAVNVLKKYDLELMNFPRSKSEYARKSLKDFRESIQKSTENITKNMNRLQSNTVNLCFAGVYSAGKSALINAILGCRILPENVESKTARMFQIRSPRFDKGEKIALSFTIGSKSMELQWNDATEQMEFIDDIPENRLVTEINSTASERREQPRHQQIYSLLEILNSDPDVGSEIHVKFPIPLDTPEVQFSIYDTPGADSNFSTHEKILGGALAGQTSSILIFIALPKKLEGSGNRKLLSLVREADSEDHRSPIDISRSIFVINAADTIPPRERKQLKNAEISDKEDSSFAIRLAEEKLLFTSARYAYAAKAFRNGLIPLEEKEDVFDDSYFFNEAVTKANEGERGKYYKDDCCASSEYATSNLVNACDEALRKAQEAGDNAEIVHVCSGLYALEHEILQYGVKYAAAVRAYAIISSVDSVLAGLNLTANSLSSKNLAEINKLNTNITKLQSEMEDSIEEIVDSFRIDDADAIPIETVRQLCLDADLIKSKVSSVQKFIINEFKSFLGHKPKDSDCIKIGSKVTKEVESICSGYLNGAQKVLSETRDKLVNEIKDYIYSNGNLTSEAKSFVCDFVSTDFDLPLIPLEEIQQAYQKSIEKKLFGLKRVNVEKLEQAVKSEVITYLSNLADQFRYQYQSSLEETVDLVQQQFVDRIGQYSALLKGMLEDKDSMEQLGNQINRIENELRVCQQMLNESIWKEEKQ